MNSSASISVATVSAGNVEPVIRQSASLPLSTALTITLGQETHPLRPGSVAVIPAGVLHSLEASAEEELEFVIFGKPPMAIDDDRAKPEFSCFQLGTYNSSSSSQL